MKVLDSLFYTEDHEWVKIDGEFAYFGISDYAQSQLGDVVFVEVNSVGETLAKGEVFATIEAVKTVSDIYMPISGEVIEFNEEIENTPDLVNKEPYDGGWIVKVKFSNPEEIKSLLSAEAYKAQIS